MFAVRFLVLAFLVAFGVSMGREPALNAFGVFIAFSVFVTVPALYLLPTYEAWLREHANLGSLALLNVFLGWTVIGWVGSLVWAFKRPEPVAVVAPSSTAPPAAKHSTTEELERLAALRDRGVLTEEEFGAQKRKLLSS